MHHDERGIIWPKSVAPFDVHLVSLGARDEHVAARILDATQSLYEDFERSGIEVLWDDRDASPGEKFADADLIGIPLRLVISEKTLSADSVEWKERNRPDAHLVPLVDVKKEAKLF